MPFSFAELEQRQIVTASELKDTLKDYAESGAAILGRVVIALVERTPLSATDRAELLAYARTGVTVQKRVCDTPSSKQRNAAESEAVIAHLEGQAAADTPTNPPP